MTPARIAANRVRAWRHGGRSRLVTQRDVLDAKLDRAIPGGAAVWAACLAAANGEFSGLDQLHLEAMAESELLRRTMLEEIRKRGVVVEESILSSAGEPIGQKLRANPALEPMRHLDEQLGHTAEQMQTTRKSRGEASVAEGLAARFRLERDAALRALDRPRRSLPLPPPNPNRTR